MNKEQVAELLKEVGEPYGYLYDWIYSSATGRPDEKYTWFTDDKSVVVRDKNDNFRDVFTSEQVAAAVLKATKPLEDEVERMTAYADKRNSQALDLEAQLAAAQEEIELLKGSHERSVNLRDQLATVEQRVAEACKSMCLSLVRKEKAHAAGYGLGYLNYSAQDVADLIESGEYRKFMKEV